MTYNYYQGLTKKRISKLVLLTIALLFALTAATATILPASARGGAADRGNSLKSESVPAEIISVETKVSDWNASDFTYYVVSFKNIDDNVQWTYREPARIGGQNHSVKWSGSANAFWFGVTGPGGSQIEHKGQVNMYYETADKTYSITAQFNGQGELLHVNGVQPE